MGAIERYYKAKKVKSPELVAMNAKEIFDAIMEGAALMLDMGAVVEYTYTTTSGNKVHMLVDSP